MAETIGEAFVKIRPDTSGFESDVDSKVGGALSGAGKTAIAGLGVLTAAAGAFGAKAVAEGTEAAQAMGQTAAAIKSTGGVANVTATQVEALAGKLGGLAGVDDDAVQAGSNLLLTFTNIRNEVGAGNDVFDKANQAMLDIAARMGTDASGAAIQLGKALNDPIAGVSSLGRAGIQFTDQQKEQIKTLQESGNILGAQKLVLAEVEKQFGGSAAAAGAAISPMDKLSLVFNDVAETVGKALIPVINALLPAITPLIEALGPALGTVVAALAPMVGELAAVLGPVLGEIVEALSPILASLAGIVVEVLKAVIPLIPPILQVVKALAPLIPLVLDLIGPLLPPLVKILTPLITILTSIIDVLMPFVEIGLGLISLVLKPLIWAFEQIGWLLDKVADGFKWVGDQMKKIGDKIPDWLKPGSPSPLETTLLGIGGALKQIGRNQPMFGGMGIPALGGIAAAPAFAGGGAAVLERQPITLEIDGQTLARIMREELLDFGRRAGPVLTGRI